MAPDEFKEKKSVSIGLVVWVGVICFNLGILYATLMATRTDVEANKRAAKDYVEQEVGGLRSDWERQNNINEADREAMKNQLDELWEYHRE